MRSSTLSKYLLIAAVTSGIIYAVQSCKKSQPFVYPPVILDFASYGCPLVGNPVYFGYFNDGGQTNSVLFDFGDGTTSTTSNYHTYTSPGTYTVTLVINNEKAYSVFTIIQIIPAYGTSGYTAHMAGVRLWSGNTDKPFISYHQLVDTSLAVQIIDAGTVAFMSDTFRLVSIDTITNKVLVFSDCGYTRLSYYYSNDSMQYNYNYPEGKDAIYLFLHTP